MTAHLCGSIFIWSVGAISDVSTLEKNVSEGVYMSESVSPIGIVDELKQSYLDYAMSVIVSRALPDVRDGFKPVHRRVMYAMHVLSNDYNKPYKKH